MQVKIEKEKNSTIEIEITVPAAEFMKHWDQALANIQKEAELDGFRKGKAPSDMIVAKYGEMAILQEMADVSINDTYMKAVIENKLQVISAPNVHIVKLAKDNDFMYHAHVEVMPEIELPDYKTLAKEVIEKKQEIKDTTDEELNSIMQELTQEVKDTTPDIENKIKENLKLEKEYLEESRLRSIFLESLVRKADEINLDAYPASFDDKSKAQFLALEIAKKEDIKANPEEVEMEVIKIMSSMPAEQMKEQKIDEARVRAYAEQIILNEKTLKSLGL